MTDSSEYQVINSPCVGVCRLDSNKICVGCFRSSEEITYWRIYTDEERVTIVDQLAERAKKSLVANQQS
jgi:uncharacterized protein